MQTVRLGLVRVLFGFDLAPSLRGLSLLASINCSALSTSACSSATTRHSRVSACCVLCESQYAWERACRVSNPFLRTSGGFRAIARSSEKKLIQNFGVYTVYKLCRFSLESYVLYPLRKVCPMPSISLRTKLGVTKKYAVLEGNALYESRLWR
jgi:hypothetical protein